MRRLLACFWILLLAISASAIERQPNADYRARREALAKKANGVVVVFAGTEASTGEAIYGFRQNDNYYYLAGITEPGGAVLVASAVAASRAAADASTGTAARCCGWGISRASMTPTIWARRRRASCACDAIGPRPSHATARGSRSPGARPS